MDAPTPPAPGRKGDAWRLSALVLLSVGLHAWVIARTEVTARDSIGFARFALHLEHPPQPPDVPEPMTRLDVVRQARHPPGYPLLVLLVSQPVRAAAGGVSPGSMVLSAQLASALAAVLLVFPMYFLGRRLFGADVAFLAAGLFQVLPVFATVSSDGLSDSLFLLAAATSLWLGVIALQRQGWGWFLLCGLASGLAYLVRPEGVVLAGAAGLVVLGLCLRGAWRFRYALARGAAVAAGLLLVMAPYVATIGKLTAKPSGANLIRSLLGLETEPAWHGAPESDATPAAPGHDGPPGALFAAWWHEPTQAGESRMAWAAESLFSELLKSFHYLPAFLALGGVVWLAPRWRREPALRLLVVLAAVHASLLWLLAVKVGYLSERHTLLIVLAGSYFAAAVLPPLGRWVASWALCRRGDAGFWTAALAALLAATALPGPLTKSLHANRAGHRYAGEWLAGHAEPDAVIYDPFCWAQFYAGRAWVIKPFPGPGATNPVYIILEPFNDNPHSRLPMIDQARLMARAGKPVYHWPPDGPLEEAEVVVYRAVPEPPR
ncbi:MAG TPA: glycosyltransferase family 39 protein [Gemmataceae bacterium]